MAGVTGGRSAREDVSDVTAGALYRNVSPSQGEPRNLMIERCTQPPRRCVTELAILRESCGCVTRTRCRVERRQVARDTCHRRSGIAASRVARCARRRDMRTH